MKPLLAKIQSFFSSLVSRFKRVPGSKPAAPMQTEAAAPPPRTKGKADRFSLISWAVTALIVTALLVSTVWWKNVGASLQVEPLDQPQPTAAPAVNQPQGSAPANGSSENGTAAIHRQLQLKTNIPERPRYEPITYRVSSGDAMLRIAEKFELKSETILYVNPQLEDNPHNLKPGTELSIPPVDGLYYEWNEGDTFETIAAKFETEPEEIINFPGNHVDLTDPKIEPGTMVMIPGGSRELRDWTQDLVTAARSNDGSTGTSDFGGGACGGIGGPVASGFGWPAGSHVISGNGYGPGHLGIDIQANEGDAVYAAGSGLVTMAQGGYNYGYGNVVQIDHGNGYITVYAHLSQINVGACTAVGQGTLIGLAGNTGNSLGTHLHFEVRRGGSSINPYEIVQ